MAFTEDISQFFDEDDFAVVAVVTLSNNTQKTVKIIFNTPTMDVAVYETDIVADKPNFFVATADLNGVKTKNEVQIGGSSYRIEKITHDGTGMSTVYLSK